MSTHTRVAHARRRSAILAGHLQLAVIGEEKKHRPLDTDPTDLAPIGAVQIGRGTRPRVQPAVLQGRITAHRVPEAAERAKSSRPASRSDPAG
jgi:hypothetical protein